MTSGRSGDPVVHASVDVCPPRAVGAELILGRTVPIGRAREEMDMTATTDAPTLTVVHTWACHFGADVQHVLAGLLPGARVTVDLVDATEPRGRALAQEHGVEQYPLVLVDGQFFSAGRLPRTELLSLLRARAA